MNLHQIGIALLASAVALQTTPCQDSTVPQKPTGIAMRVTTSVGAVGNPCEAFDCVPHQSLGNLGERLALEIYALEGSPYVLFFGLPATNCQQVPQMDNALALWAPIVILEFGTVAATRTGGPCDVPFRATTFVIPTTAPLGMQFRLQMFGSGLADEGLGFSRAVEIHTR